MTDKIEQTDTPAPKDDPVATFILDMLADGKSYTFKDIAMSIFDGRKRPKDRADGWRRYMTAVKQQSLFLARKGRVEIMRKGQVADPEDFKGIVQVRLASKAKTKKVKKAAAEKAAAEKAEKA